jgi:hypothetical protein
MILCSTFAFWSLTAARHRPLDSVFRERPVTLYRLVRFFGNELPRPPKVLDDVATIKPSKCDWRIERVIVIIFDGQSSRVRLATCGPDCSFDCEICPITALLR